MFLSVKKECTNNMSHPVSSRLVGEEILEVVALGIGPTESSHWRQA